MKAFSIKDVFAYTYDNVKAINDSKLFAGMIVVILNISSKFTTVPLSPTMESYLRNTFSRHILVFAICWMGTREIISAITLFTIVSLLMQVFLNENSPFCCLTEEFTTHHMSLAQDTTDNILTKEEIDTCMRILEKAKNLMNKASKNDDDNNNNYDDNNNGNSAAEIHYYLNQTMVS
jgi:hypothetical protein